MRPQVQVAGGDGVTWKMKGWWFWGVGEGGGEGGRKGVRRPPQLSLGDKCVLGWLRRGLKTSRLFHPPSHKKDPPELVLPTALP